VAYLAVVEGLLLETRYKISSVKHFSFQVSLRAISFPKAVNHRGTGLPRSSASADSLATTK